MGADESYNSNKPSPPKSKQLESIYSMFQESNRVILRQLKLDNPSISSSKIKNLNSVIDQLVQPFQECVKYTWGKQISQEFKQHFTVNFQALWKANREQFYEFLLLNCNFQLEEARNHPQFRGNYQDFLYDVAIQRIEESIPDHIDLDRLDIQKKMDFVNASILDQEISEAKNVVDDDSFPLVMPMNKTPPADENTPKKVGQFRKKEYLKKIRVENSSVLIAETVFSDRMNKKARSQVADMLKYYSQFTNTLQQIFHSNNLISCPFKHFVLFLEDKLLRKKIRHSTREMDRLLISQDDEARKLRVKREANNNYILVQVKEFLQAYTQFVWMYLQLHLMAESRMGKIITSEILYGVIFKCMWGFIDWIADRGYQYEEIKLEEYFREYESPETQKKLSEGIVTYYVSLLERLRGEKHPQQFLKKVVVFYREVAKSCQNADQLLVIYEDIIGRTVARKGMKDLHLFRMRNIIEKLLRIDESSLSGGEISYSWTTWCIVLQLLRERVNFKYGSMVISSKKSLPSNIT